MEYSRKTGVLVYTSQKKTKQKQMVFMLHTPIYNSKSLTVTVDMEYQPEM